MPAVTRRRGPAPSCRTGRADQSELHRLTVTNEIIKLDLAVNFFVFIGGSNERRSVWINFYKLALTTQVYAVVCGIRLRESD